MAIEVPEIETIAATERVAAQKNFMRSAYALAEAMAIGETFGVENAKADFVTAHQSVIAAEENERLVQAPRLLTQNAEKAKRTAEHEAARIKKAEVVKFTPKPKVDMTHLIKAAHETNTNTDFKPVPPPVKQSPKLLSRPDEIKSGWGARVPASAK